MKGCAIALSLVLVVSGAHASLGQVGKGSGLWSWSKDGAHHDSVIEVSAAGGTGTGVVVGIDPTRPVADGFVGYALTANHVVEDVYDSSIRVRFSNGRKAKGCQVLQRDAERDIALISVWVPNGIAPIAIASRPVKAGEALEYVGLGGGSDVKGAARHFRGKASVSTSLDKIFADVPLLPGDSGGAVFNSDRELVGIISGGWFWFDGGVRLEGGTKIKPTWPARSSNVGPIRALLKKVRGALSTNASR